MMMATLLATFIVSILALPVCAAEANNTDVASSCRYCRHFSYEGGNMTCPDSAPVLASLETTAPEGAVHVSLPTTNWTMVCDCPEWSLPNTDDSAEWIAIDIYSRLTHGFTWISCLRNQYLSGLAYTIDPEALTYLWWGRCSNFPVGYTKEESSCWTSNTILSQGSNRSLSLPGEKVVFERVKFEYPSYSGYDFYNTRWRYVFCTVLDVKCQNPRISNGYTELSASDDDFFGGISDQSSKGYNESIQIHCRQGFYMEGPSVATCQANGEWSQLPNCRACKSIRYCKVHSCRDGQRSHCLKCKPYTSTGYQVALNRNGRKCRVVPYINRTQITFLFVYMPGQTIRMDCPAYGIPAPKIVWFSQTLNQSVANVINSSRLHFFSNGSLEISDLKPEDEALYSCTAVNSVGMDKVYLLVINEEAYRFYRTPIAPVINQSTVILFFDANEHAMLHCHASGTPSPWIYWYKLENEQLHSLPPYDILRIKKHRNGSLAFAPILQQDWGIYACEAVNDYGHDVAMWIVCVGDSCGGTYSGGVDDPPPYLFIEFAPIIVQWTKVHIVSEGNSISIPCVAGGNPPPVIEWRRGNAVISESDTLTLKQVSIHNTGIYSCVARNHMGEASREMAVIIETVQQPTTQPDSSPSTPSVVEVTTSDSIITIDVGPSRASLAVHTTSTWTASLSCVSVFSVLINLLVADSSLIYP